MKRDDAWAVLTEFTQDKSLIKHALAVEAAMRAYAHKYGEDEEQWGVVGLIHDFDYERFPTIPEHTGEGAKILRARGWPEEIIGAAMSHASYSGIARDTRMAKALYAVDELTGLIMAAALVRPTKDIRDITEIKSIKSKFKDKAFAAGVNRQEVTEGAEALGAALWEEHVPLVLEAMKGIAAEIELDGRLIKPRAGGAA
jgi:putative nucleotidyltransferase with HDIG domain